MDQARKKSYKHFWRLFLLSFVVSLGWCSMGYSYSVFNATSINLALIMDWPSDETAIRCSLLVGAIPAGAIVTLLIVIVKYFSSSRKLLLIVADALTIVGTILSFFNQFWLFFVGRLFIGLGFGINAPIVPVYIREYAPSEISGQMGGSIGIAINFGVLLAFCLAFGLPYEANEDEWYWRFMYGFTLLFSLIRMLSFLIYYKDDTPKYYVLQDKTEKAKEVISKIYKEEAQEETLNHIKADKENEHKESFKDLAQNYRKQVLICFMLASLIQLAGNITIVAYSTAILTDSSNTPRPSDSQFQETKKINLIIGIIRFVSSFLAGFLLGKFGRKTLLITGSVLITISLLLLGIGLDYDIKVLAEIMLLLFTCGICIGFGLVNNVYYSDLLSSRGCSLMQLWENMINLLLNFAFPLLASSPGFGIPGTLYVMSGISLLGLIGIMKFLLETKGLTKKEISEKFRNEKTSNLGRQEQTETEAETA